MIYQYIDCGGSWNPTRYKTMTDLSYTANMISAGDAMSQCIGSHCFDLMIHKHSGVSTRKANIFGGGT